MRRGGLAHPAADRLLEFYQNGFDNLASLQKGFENLASLSCSILLGCLLEFYWHAFYTLRGGMPADLDTSGHHFAIFCSPMSTKTSPETQIAPRERLPVL